LIFGYIRQKNNKKRVLGKIDINPNAMELANDFESSSMGSKSTS
jgi:hypothetical protein